MHGNPLHLQVDVGLAGNDDGDLPRPLTYEHMNI